MARRKRREAEKERQRAFEMTKSSSSNTVISMSSSGNGTTTNVSTTSLNSSQSLESYKHKKLPSVPPPGNNLENNQKRAGNDRVNGVPKTDVLVQDTSIPAEEHTMSTDIPRPTSAAADENRNNVNKCFTSVRHDLFSEKEANATSDMIRPPTLERETSSSANKPPAVERQISISTDILDNYGISSNSSSFTSSNSVSPRNSLTADSHNSNKSFSQPASRSNSKGTDIDADDRSMKTPGAIYPDDLDPKVKGSNVPIRPGTEEDLRRVSYCGAEIARILILSVLAVMLEVLIVARVASRSILTATVRQTIAISPAKAVLIRLLSVLNPLLVPVVLLAVSAVIIETTMEADRMNVILHMR